MDGIEGLMFCISSQVLIICNFFPVVRLLHFKLKCLFCVCWFWSYRFWHVRINWLKVFTYLCNNFAQFYHRLALVLFLLERLKEELISPLQRRYSKLLGEMLWCFPSTFKLDQIIMLWTVILAFDFLEKIRAISQVGLWCKQFTRVNCQISFWSLYSGC